MIFYGWSMVAHQSFAMYAFSNLAHHHLLKGRSEMPMFQARIIRQEVAITEVEGDTLETAKEKAESVARERRQSQDLRLGYS